MDKTFDPENCELRHGKQEEFTVMVDECAEFLAYQEYGITSFLESADWHADWNAFSPEWKALLEEWQADWKDRFSLRDACAIARYIAWNYGEDWDMALLRMLLDEAAREADPMALPEL